MSDPVEYASYLVCVVLAQSRVGVHDAHETQGPFVVARGESTVAFDECAEQERRGGSDLKECCQRLVEELSSGTVIAQADRDLGHVYPSQTAREAPADSPVDGVGLPVEVQGDVVLVGRAREVRVQVVADAGVGKGELLAGEVAGRDAHGQRVLIMSECSVEITGELSNYSEQ